MKPGLRMTEQRRVILEELRMTRSHPTADELYGRVRARLPRISLGTVYRNLERLADSGMIRKLDHPGSKRRFDGDLRGHQHIRCVVCGRVEDIDAPAEPAGGDDEGLFDSTGFSDIERRIEYVGVCPECQSKNDG